MTKRKFGIKSLLVVIGLILPFQAFEVKAAPGDPDPTFAAHSVKFTIYGKPDGAFMNRIEVQSDGKYTVQDDLNDVNFR